VGSRSLLPAGLLDKTATVYAADPAAGGYTVAAKSGLRCRLSIVGSGQARSGDERAELAALRRLYWAESYAMPNDVQVEIDDERWNVMNGTQQAPTMPGGAVAYRSCDLARAD
jgi:hypothetical protein